MEDLPLYIKMSYPFLQVDKRVHTPMLFLGGSRLNVPLVGGEQMYEALQSLAAHRAGGLSRAVPRLHAPEFTGPHERYWPGRTST